MVFLMMGVALGLLSLLPSIPAGFNSQGGVTLRPKTYYVSPYSRINSPQVGLQVTVEMNNTVQLYLIGEHALQLSTWTEEWVTAQYPHLSLPEIQEEMLKVDVLTAVLSDHPEALLLNETVNLEGTFQYFPPQITTVTIVIVNPHHQLVDDDFQMVEIATLVPRDRVLIPSLSLLIVGGILSIPWVIKKKKRRRPNKKMKKEGEASFKVVDLVSSSLSNES